MNSISTRHFQSIFLLTFWFAKQCRGWRHYSYTYTHTHSIRMHTHLMHTHTHFAQNTHTHTHSMNTRTHLMHTHTLDTYIHTHTTCILTRDAYTHNYETYIGTHTRYIHTLEAYTHTHTRNTLTHTHLIHTQAPRSTTHQLSLHGVWTCAFLILRTLICFSSANIATCCWKQAPQVKCLLGPARDGHSTPSPSRHSSSMQMMHVRTGGLP